MEERQFEEAMARMVQGDQSALKEIYESYVGYIYRIIYEVLRNKENAEDVTSEFLSGYGIKRSSLGLGADIRDIWQPWPGTWRLTFCGSTGGRS